MRLLLPIVVAFVSVSSTGAVHADSLARGKSLYETKCHECHSRSVHHRESRKAKSYTAVRKEVERWEGALGGGWSKEDVDDVTLYLNETYYKHPCPKSTCRSGRSSNDPAS